MEIPYWGLFFSLLLFAVPFAVFFRLDRDLLRSSAVAVGRMTIQLLLVAVYMRWLYGCNSMVLDATWMVLMTAAAAFSIANRSCLRWQKLLLPVAAGLFVSVVLACVYMLVAVVRPANITNTSCIVPVFGLLLSGVQSVGKAVLEAFYSELRRNSGLYFYLLGNGASHKEAILPFLRDALKKGYAPLVANVSVAGIVTMPGMMMGAMLGGVGPGFAAVWQIGIAACVFAAPIVFTAVVLYLADNRVFDRYGRLRNVFNED